jgi:hypothetical protein
MACTAIEVPNRLARDHGRLAGVGDDRSSPVVAGMITRSAEPGREAIEHLDADLGHRWLGSHVSGTLNNV